MEDQNICDNPECKKPATLKCPTCDKLGLKAAFFCTKECFKNFWPIHKLFHKKGKTPLNISLGRRD